MFSKSYVVDPKHIDFQGVVDGLYYPFYFEWARHAFLKESLGIDIGQLFEQGQQYILVEYNLRFRKALRRDDTVVITVELQKHHKANLVNVHEKMFVEDVLYAEGTFVATCLYRGRPTLPAVILEQLKAE